MKNTKSKKSRCERHIIYYDDSYKHCINCKWRKKMKWDGSDNFEDHNTPLTFINGKAVW